MWVIVVVEEHEDWGEGGMVITPQVADVVGPFPTKEKADEHDQRVYLRQMFVTTDVIEVTLP